MPNPYDQDILFLLNKDLSHESFTQELEKTGEGLSISNRVAYFFRAGVLSSEHSRYHEAKFCWKQARALINKFERAYRPKCELNIGVMYLQTGDYASAQSTLEQALRYAKTFQDPVLEQQCLTNLGIVSFRLGDYHGAEARQRKSLRLAKKLGKDAEIPSCLANLGNIRKFQGRLREAKSLYEKALVLSRSMGDERMECDWLGNISSILLDLGDFHNAVSYAKAALQIAELHSYSHGIFTSHTVLGTAYRVLGKFQESLLHAKQGLYLATELQIYDGICRGLLNVGHTFENLGQIFSALPAYQKALDIARSIKDVNAQGICYFNLGRVYIDVPDIKSSQFYFQKAKHIARKLNDWDLLSHCHIEIGNLAMRNKAFAKAETAYREALRFSKHTGNTSAKARSLLSLGTIAKNRDHAIKLYKQGLKLALAMKDPDLESSFLFNLAGELRDKKPHRAIKLYEQAIILYERMTSSAMEEKTLIDLNASRGHIYPEVITLCSKLGMSGAMFDYSERSRSRAFLASLGAIEVPLSIFNDKLSEREKTLLKKERQLIDQIKATTFVLATPQPRSQSVSDIDRLMKQLQITRARIGKFAPEFIDLRVGSPLTLKGLQACLHA